MVNASTVKCAAASKPHPNHRYLIQDRPMPKIIVDTSMPLTTHQNANIFAEEALSQTLKEGLAVSHSSCSTAIFIHIYLEIFSRGAGYAAPDYMYARDVDAANRLPFVGVLKITARYRTRT